MLAGAVIFPVAFNKFQSRDTNHLAPRLTAKQDFSPSEIFTLSLKEKKEMKVQRNIVLTIAVALIVFGAMACGSKNSTPTKALQTFLAAAKNKDVAALKSVMPKEFLEMGEQRAKAQNKTLDDMLKQLLESGNTRAPSKMETRNEIIAPDGKTATVEVKGDSEQWETFYLLKEDDGWKIDYRKLMGR
ncbi:MAG TPA: nuclear transport factor 2 family protein [Pyrinomonadaceae bacterium]